MSEKLLTVAEAAELLSLHVKTVRRLIREDRLKAGKMGKSYRITRAALDRYAGAPVAPATRPERSAMTAIVEIEDVGDRLAQKWARSVTAALRMRPDTSVALRADVTHDPGRKRLKIIATGPVADVTNLMNLVQIWMGQLRA